MRRNEFFRTGAVARQYGRGKRWLLLRRWKNLKRGKSRQLDDLFAVNRRLYKPYMLREELDCMPSYVPPSVVRNFLGGWVGALRWQRLPGMEKLAAPPRRNLDGIVAFGRHRVRFGVVEDINTTIKDSLRRARSMRDDQLLLLEIKWVTANPIPHLPPTSPAPSITTYSQIGEGPEQGSG